MDRSKDAVANLNEDGKVNPHQTDKSGYPRINRPVTHITDGDENLFRATQLELFNFNL